MSCINRVLLVTLLIFGFQKAVQCSTSELYYQEYESSCIVCDDIESPAMDVSGVWCSELSNRMIDLNCNSDDFWKNNRICQLTCFRAGKGYEGDVCCDNPAYSVEENDEFSTQIEDNTLVKEAPELEPSKTTVKVFLMVGQSNMQGHGYIDNVDSETQAYKNGTLEMLAQSQPDQFGKLKDQSGDWVERSDTWIAYNRQAYSDMTVTINQHGNLKPGYGGDPNQNHIGPELGFGWTVADALNSDDREEKQQILLIKIAWGGKSLAVDYRPPSSGGQVGPYYQTMIDTTMQALTELEEMFPEYTSINEFELAGFVWHQGWNDGCNQTMAAEYEYNLANLIRDVRHDLGVPDLPVSIGVSGQFGYDSADTPVHRTLDDIVDAQFSVADDPEFAGTVTSVDTRAFTRTLTESPGEQVYHWNNNCETYWLIGEAMGQAMLDLLENGEELSA